MRLINIALALSLIFSQHSHAANIDEPAQPLDANFVAKTIWDVLGKSKSVESSALADAISVIGTPIKSKNFDEQIFPLFSARNFFELASPDTKRLLKFLTEVGLARNVGRIETDEILARRLVPNQLKPLKKYIQDNMISFRSGTVISAFTKDNAKATWFSEHNFYPALLLEKKNPALDEVAPELKELFAENYEVSQIFAQINKFDVKIKNDLQLLKKILAMPDENDAYAEFISSQVGPKYLRDRWTRRQDRFRREREKILKSSTTLAPVHDERMASLAIINQSPINALLLYCFYVVETEKSQFLSEQEFQIWHDVLTLYDLERDSPHLTLLQPIAHQLLERFGFFDQSTDSAIASSSSSQNSNEKPAKFNQGKKIKKKQKKKKCTRAKKQHATSTAQNKSIELAEEEGDILISQKTYASVAREKISPQIIEAAIQEPSLLVIEEEKEGINDFSSPKSLCCAFGHGAKNNPTLNRTESHCAFDMLARLLRAELYSSRSKSAGTIALALIFDRETQRDRLVIATKNNLSPDLVANALSDLIAYRILPSENDKEAIHTELAQLKNRIPFEDDAKAKRELISNFSSLRSQLDALRMRAIFDSPKDNIQERIFNLLKTFKPESIIVLPNSLSMHPELKVADFLFQHGLDLDYLPSSSSSLQSLRYQYIGVSMLNCAGCDAVLRGTEDIIGINSMAFEKGLVIFTKGSYAAVYPGFVLPDSSLARNSGARSLKEKISKLAPLIPPFESKPVEIFLLQEGEISDDDEEL